MIKTLQQALKMDREKFKVPRSVQQAIPIQRIWPDGVFQSGTKFSKTFRFSDINYAIASKEDKTEMFLDYSELLNALDSGAAAKITLNNRQINKEEFEASLLLPMKEDGLDEYRKEYNEMLLSKVSGTNNSIYQERYLTVSVHKKNLFCTCGNGYHHPSEQAVLHWGRTGCGTEVTDLPGFLPGR